MNEQQIKAAKILKRALTKCRDAGLALDALTDVGLYVSPVDLRGDPRREEDTQAWYREHGFDCQPSSFHFDGGAGV